MIDKDTYKRELVRMWDSLRAINKGESTCISVKCKECPFNKSERGCRGGSFIDVFEKIEIVERWSKEHPPKKFKVSRMEYDLLQTVINFSSTIDTFNDFCTFRGLIEKGYFEGATGSMYISDYYNNCEVDA